MVLTDDQLINSLRWEAQFYEEGNLYTLAANRLEQLLAERKINYDKHKDSRTS